jgi:hypothetical protein
VLLPPPRMNTAEQLVENVIGWLRSLKF